MICRSDLLLIIRCCLRLSQREFAKKLGGTKDWVRHTESGKNRIIHEGPANRWIPQIEKLMRSSQITLDKTLKFWRMFKFARDQKFPEIKTKMNPISKATEEGIKTRFELLKKKTRNFTEFNPEILINNPQDILIFRLILGLDHRKFARMLNKSPRGLRAWEHLEMMIKPKTANDVMKTIKDIFSILRPNTQLKNVLFNFRVLSNKHGNRNLKSQLRVGLNFAKRQKLSEIERETITALEKIGVKCSKDNNELEGNKTAEIHAIVDGLKRKFNVDFAFPNGRNPKILLEVFRFNIKNRPISNSKIRVCHIDHRFQMIKAKNPEVSTIMFIKFVGKPIHEELTQRSLELEILNTDHLIINDIKKLIFALKKQLNKLFILKN